MLSFNYLHLSRLYCFVTMFSGAVQSISFYFPAMAEGNPPTKGKDLDLNNELPVTGERKQFSKTAILLSSK